MNNIPQEQNAQDKLEMLAAQRQLYSDAKNLYTISVVIAVPVVIGWSILVAVIPELAVYAALWGIIATLLEIVVLSPLRNSKQEKAAKIQQIFDCQVLEFNWKSLNCGIKVEPELIVETSNRYKRKHKSFSVLENWYPVSVGQLPLHLARIICQRSNVWWDAKLRRRYSKLILAILIILTIIILLIGLVGGFTVEKLVLAVLAPLLPTFVLGLRQYKEHNQAASRLDRLRENAQIIVNKVAGKNMSQQEIETESYSLQTEIYDNRRRSPLIFDWIYSRLKRKDEEQMNKGAEILVKELTESFY